MKTLALSLLLLATDKHLQAVRDAIEKTGSEGYAYEVKGRWERSGEVRPGDVVTSRIKQYQSIRHGEEILVKGPEGLWKTPPERLGEKVERPDPDAPSIIRNLEGARAPHAILRELLELVSKGREPEDREVDGVMCRRYLLPYSEDPLKASVEALMDKAVKAGDFERPDKVRWSTLKGTVAVYVSKDRGLLRKVRDERSVEMEYKVPDLPPKVKKYKLEWEYAYSEWGKRAVLPPEVRERLKIPDE